MQVEEELGRVAPQKDTVLTIGVFDGVHLGHKHLISRLKEEAGKRNLLSGLVTFRQHPQRVLSPETRLPFLTSINHRLELIKAEGVDIVVALTFDRELAGMRAVDFINLLKKYLRMRGLVVGPDFALGRNCEGDVTMLQKIGKDMDFSIVVAPPLEIKGEVVSSTAIRKALAGGDMAKVTTLMGRPFRLQGKVVAGKGRGAKLGFPTANITVDAEQALPPEGIYATRAYVDNKIYPSMTNIGTCPTFNGSERTVEVYIIDFHNNLYGHELKIDVIQRLRDEKRFDTVEDLKRQIATDVETGRAILEGKKT